MIKAVVFDMGGTLEDLAVTPKSVQTCGEKILEHLALHGVPLPYDPDVFMKTAIANGDAYRVWSLTCLRELMPYEQWSLWRMKNMPIDQDILRAISEDLMFIWETEYFVRTLRPDAESLLKRLKEKGYALGVISNTGSLTQVYYSLEAYGIRKYFETVCLSCISGFRKPHPILFEMTARNLGLLPEECMYVGDTLTRDVIGSRRAGYGKCVRIGSFLTGPSDMQVAIRDEEKADADYVVEHLSEIAGLLNI